MTEKTITPTENLVQVFCGVRGYEKDGVAYLHIEDSARGLGFTRIKESGNEVVRWDRVDSYLNDLKFVGPTCGPDENPHDFYIPENIFYRLCMKAKNEVAEKFQAKVADEIIPSIRKTGKYEVNQPQTQPMMCLPQDYESALEALLTEVRKSKALQAERDETKALLAEERGKIEALNEAVDNLERTKAWINDKKVASALGTAGAKSKECERLKRELGRMEAEINLQMPTIRDAIRKEFEGVWTTAREWCFKHKLPVYASEPKWTVSNRLADICLTYPDREQWHMNEYGTRLFPKWACDVLDKVYDDDNTFLIEYRTV